VAENLELHQLGVVARRGVKLVANAPWLVVRAPDVEAAGRLRGCELPDRLAVLEPLELHVDAVPPDGLGLGLVEDHVDLDAAGGPSLLAHVDARLCEHGHLVRRHRRCVDVELVRVSAGSGCWCCRGRGQPRAERGDDGGGDGDGESDKQRTTHDPTSRQGSEAGAAAQTWRARAVL
jgi:hypothetical protein